MTKRRFKDYLKIDGHRWYREGNVETKAAGKKWRNELKNKQVRIVKRGRGNYDVVSRSKR